MKDRILVHFGLGDFPEDLKEIPSKFAELAEAIACLLPDNEDRHFALKKLLEARDCAMRAHTGSFGDDRPYARNLRGNPDHDE